MATLVCPRLSNRSIRIGLIVVVVLLSLTILAVIVYAVFRSPLKAHERAEYILSRAPLIDGQNAFPSNVRSLANNDLRAFNFSSNLTQVKQWHTMMTDIPRMQAGKLGAQVWSAYAPCMSQHKDAVVLTLEQIDLIKRIIANYSQSLELALDSKDITKIVQKGKIASIIAVDGGHSIQYSLGVLRTYYDLGVRSMALVADCTVPWAQSYRTAIPEPSNKSWPHPLLHGLTPFGKEVIWEMNRLGMIVDVAHCAFATMKDAITVSDTPVIISRSAAKAICNKDPNISDEIMSFLHRREGLMMINFYPHHIACNSSANITDVIRHLDYIRAKMSIDNIGIGSNFDGIDGVTTGLEDVSKFPNLFAALLETGRWTEEDLEKLAGKNFLRVMKEVETRRDRYADAEPSQLLIKRGDVLPFTNMSCSGTRLL